jgi:hypothetical protein
MTIVINELYSFRTNSLRALPYRHWDNYRFRRLSYATIYRYSSILFPQA